MSIDVVLHYFLRYKITLFIFVWSAETCRLIFPLFSPRPTEDKPKKVKAVAKPKPVIKAKVEDDEEGWTEVSAGARPQVLSTS